MRPMFRIVVIAVATAHLFLIGSMLFSRSKEQLYIRPPIHVRTRTMAPQVKAVSASPLKKPVAKKAPIKKSPAKKFIKEIAKDLALPTPVQLSVPKPVDFSEKILDDSSTAVYQDLLINTLRERLKLPGPGTVKLKLTLTKSGIIRALEVLSSESELNRGYLESHLKLLDFPPFEGDLEGTDEQTFLLSFCSD